MKILHAALAVTILVLASCANFDVVPEAVYDPETGKWSFSADVVPTPSK